MFNYSQRFCNEASAAGNPPHNGHSPTSQLTALMCLLFAIRDAFVLKYLLHS